MKMRFTREKVCPRESMRLCHTCAWHSRARLRAMETLSPRRVKKRLLLVWFLQSDTVLIPSGTQEQLTAAVLGWASLWKCLKWRDHWSCSSSSRPCLPVVVRSGPGRCIEACSKCVCSERFSVGSEQIPGWAYCCHLRPNWALWLLQKLQASTELSIVFGAIILTEFKIKFGLTFIKLVLKLPIPSKSCVEFNLICQINFHIISLICSHQVIIIPPWSRIYRRLEQRVSKLAQRQKAQQPRVHRAARGAGTGQNRDHTHHTGLGVCHRGDTGSHRAGVSPLGSYSHCRSSCTLEKIGCGQTAPK